MEAIERLTALEQTLVAVEREIRDAAAGAGHLVTATQALLVARLPADDAWTVDRVTIDAYTGTNTTYNVKKLVGAGYLTIRQHPGDGRCHLVELTEKGRALRLMVRGLLEKCRRLRPEQLKKDLRCFDIASPAPLPGSQVLRR